VRTFPAPSSLLVLAASPGSCRAGATRCMVSGGGGDRDAAREPDEDAAASRPADSTAERDRDARDSLPGLPPRRIVDPDVDLGDPRQDSVARRGERAVLAAIALGGVAGAEARYAIGVLVPRVPAQFPWPTWLINTTGCLLLGVLMVIVTEQRTVSRLIRPFLGAGLLGGFTTFSGFAEEVLDLTRAGRPAVALAYLALTLAGGWAAAWAGMTVTRQLGRRGSAR